MITATVRFESYQGSANIAPVDGAKARSSGTVFFTLIIPKAEKLGSAPKNEIFSGLTATVAHPFGTSFEDSEFEVSRVAGGYEGPWNHAGFSDLASDYVRSLIGKTGMGIHISGGCKDIIIEQMRLGRQFDAPLLLDPDAELSGGWIRE